MLINIFVKAFVYISEFLSKICTLNQPEYDSWWSSAYLADRDLQYPISNPRETWQVWMIAGYVQKDGNYIGECLLSSFP